MFATIANLELAIVKFLNRVSPSRPAVRGEITTTTKPTSSVRKAASGNAKNKESAPFA
jgi:hypothetical protein